MIPGPRRASGAVALTLAAVGCGPVDVRGDLPGGPVAFAHAYYYERVATEDAPPGLQVATYLDAVDCDAQDALLAAYAAAADGAAADGAYAATYPEPHWLGQLVVGLPDAGPDAFDESLTVTPLQAAFTELLGGEAPDRYAAAAISYVRGRSDADAYYAAGGTLRVSRSDRTGPLTFEASLALVDAAGASAGQLDLSGQAAHCPGVQARATGVAAP